MIYQIQKLHETKHSIEQRLSAIDEIMGNSSTSINNYCIALGEQKELKEKLFEVNKSLNNLL